MAAVPANVFNIATLTEFFDKSLTQISKDISLAEYLNGYDELLHFLQTLSKAFYFVVKDVDEKLKVLRGHLNGPQGDSYHLVSSMLKYEKENGFKFNGSRTLLRLHRAMIFIVLIFTKLVEEPPEVTISVLVGDAYNSSLSQHHGWTVRKAVGVALYLLPTRETLATNISEMNSCSVEECRQLMRTAITSLQKVYDLNQQLYADFDALGLA